MAGTRNLPLVTDRPGRRLFHGDIVSGRAGTWEIEESGNSDKYPNLLLTTPTWGINMLVLTR